jgi:hypothetical protein
MLVGDAKAVLPSFLRRRVDLSREGIRAMAESGGDFYLAPGFEKWKYPLQRLFPERQVHFLSSELIVLSDDLEEAQDRLSKANDKLGLRFVIFMTPEHYSQMAIHLDPKIPLVYHAKGKDQWPALIEKYARLFPSILAYEAYVRIDPALQKRKFELFNEPYVNLRLEEADFVISQFVQRGNFNLFRDAMNLFGWDRFYPLSFAYSLQQPDIHENFLIRKYTPEERRKIVWVVKQLRIDRIPVTAKLIDGLRKEGFPFGK